MKQRVNLALADIRFIQTEIEKILNKQKNNQKEEEITRKDRKNSKSYQSNASPTSRKNSKPYQNTSKNTSPRAKKKQSPKTKVKTVENSPKKIEEMETKIIKTQPKLQKNQIKPIPVPHLIQQKQIQNKQVNEQRSIMQMWKQKQKDTKKPQQQKAQIPDQNNHKSVMAMWKQRQKQKAVNIKQQPLLNLTKSKQNSQTKDLSNQNNQNNKDILNPFTIVQQIFNSQGIYIRQPVEVHHLLKKNNIPLRTDEDYLKKKYNYSINEHPKQKQQELKERYRLLDERLLRLKYQIKTRDSNLFLSSQGHNQSKQAKVIKKHALAKYDRYSPIGKFVRINQKLKKDYERSLSNKQRHIQKKKVEIEQGRSAWLK